MAETIFLALKNSYEISWIVSSEKNSNITKVTKKENIKIYNAPTNTQLEKILKIEPLDAVIIGSFDKILPATLLKKSKFINIHLGDLPKYRGRANVNWAIINEEKSIMLTIHEAIEELDAGNIYAKYLIPIHKLDTVGDVYKKVNKVLEKEIVSVVLRVINGYKGVKQKGIPTYCCARLPQDGLIDWTQKTTYIDRFIRAQTYPYPGAFTFYEGRKMIIWACKIPPNPKKFVGRIPGRVCAIYKNHGIEVLTGNSSIIITDIFYNAQNRNASEVVKSVKKTLGINLLEFYEN